MFCDERLDQFSECWEGLDDPRSGNAALHDFHELLPIALCAVLSGGQGAVDMALFAKTKETYLRGFLRLKNGPPSHDTFSRLFRSLDPEQLRTTFQRFIAKFSAGCQGPDRHRHQVQLLGHRLGRNMRFFPDGRKVGQLHKPANPEFTR